MAPALTVRDRVLGRNPSPTPFCQMLSPLGPNFNSDPDAVVGGGEIGWARAIGDGFARGLTDEAAPTVEAGSPAVAGAPASAAEGSTPISGQSANVRFSDGASWALAEAMVSQIKSGRSRLTRGQVQSPDAPFGFTVVHPELRSSVVSLK